MRWCKVIEFVLLVLAIEMMDYGGATCGDEQLVDTLVSCDSALSANLTQQILIGNGYCPKMNRVDMILPGKAVPVALFIERGGIWHEPIFHWKRTYWRPTNDSVTIAVHRRANLEDYLFPTSNGDKLIEIYKGITADLVWNPARDSFRTEEIILDTVIFPRDTYFYWDWGGEKVKAGFMYLGSASAPLFYAVMGLTSPDDESYTHWANEGLWHRYGDQYVPLGFLELSRKYSEMEGYERQDLETVHRVEDTDGDGESELVYSRKYTIALEGKQVEYSDVGEIVFEFREGDPPPPLCNYIGNITGIAPRQRDRIGTPVGTIIGLPPRYVVLTSTSGRRRTTLQPERMRMADGSLFPIRPHLPVLLFPRLSVTTPVESTGRADTLVSLLGPPRFNGHIIRLGVEHFSPFEESGFCKDHRSTLSIRLTDDSVEFEASIWQRSSERSGAAICSLSDCWLVLWFDTDLLGDFRDSSCTSDDIMLIVRKDLGDSTACIERFQLEEHDGNFIPIPIDQVIRGFMPPFDPKYSPLTFRWRMARHDIGLVEHQGRPAMCGFAAEVVCPPTAGAVDCSFLAFELAYPPNFNRTDPRTWGTLMVANQKDTTYTSNR